MSAPRPGQQEQLSARSRATRAGGEQGGEAWRSAPGSSRGSAGGTGCGGRRRVPAHPAAPAPPRAGTPRPLPQSWGRPEPPGDGGKGARGQDKGGTRARGPPRTWKLLEALKTPRPARTTRARPRRTDLPRACGVPGGCALAAPIPPRNSRSGPRTGSAGLFFCVRGTHGVSATLQGQWPGSPLPQPAGTEKPKAGRKGQRAPTDTGERRSARRAAWLRSEEPRAHLGEACGAKFKLPVGDALDRGRGLLPGEVQRSGQSKDLPPGPRAGKAVGGRVGVRPGAPGPGSSGESSHRRSRWGAPRAGAAQELPGRAPASAKTSGAKRGPNSRPGGAPSGRGLGWGRRAERR